MEEVFALGPSFKEMLSFPVFAFFAEVETGDRPEISHHASPDVRLLAARSAIPAARR